MDDALLVRGREAAGDLDRPVHGAAQRQLSGRDGPAERLALEELHDEDVLRDAGEVDEDEDEEGISSNE